MPEDIPQAALELPQGPTRRWQPAKLHAKQKAFYESKARFNVVAAGRRSFKTEAAKRRLVKKALRLTVPEGQVFACAPTHQQAKDIFWEDLKALIPRDALLRGDPRKDISDGELRIYLCNGACIRVAGLDRPQRVEGGFWDHGVITEFGNVRDSRYVLESHIVPMTLRGGSIDIEGVPEGRNEYYDVAMDARAREAEGDLEWRFHHWTTREVLHYWLGVERANKELAHAENVLDALVYSQEYEASFVSFSGLAYYNFDVSTHAAKKLEYNSNLQLIFAFDFNESPGTATVLQEGPIEQADGSKVQGTYVLDEVYIPRHSKTPMVCDRLLKSWGHHEGPVRCYGDATGGAGGSAKVQGSDWDLIRKKLKPAYEDLAFMVPNDNPRERTRVNAMNTRLKANDGTVRMLVNPSCKHTVKDFEGVQTVEGGSGELDKHSDKKLTHLTDGIGYYVAYKFPVQGRTGDVIEI